MRGVVTFMAAQFLVVVWYVVAAFLFEPLIDLNRGVALAPIGGFSSVQTTRDILFLWAPMVFEASWFIWAVRYYLRKNRLRGRGEVRP